MMHRVGYYGAVKRVDENGSEVTEGPGKYKRITRVHDQWTRMREDKLKSMRKALYYSYQAAICQPYNATNDAIIKTVTSIITTIEDDKEFTDNQITACEMLEKQYPDLAAVGMRRSPTYVAELDKIIKENEGSYFRCLINHDKLKVEYEDKILSIPFEENTVNIDPVIDNNDLVETGFHTGTVFKWIHGNKEDWVPDSYWIVYMQYSEETAYFRGEIRKADEEINIVVINDDGSETEKTYHGWMTGPNEDSIKWNVKKGVIWNDLNYTKTLYITKDKDTSAFFKRFDRVVINGQTWEVQAYNDNYGTSSSNPDSGIIRVALKETYTSTDQQIKEQEQQEEERKQNAAAAIIGPDVLAPYDTATYTVENAGAGSWSVSVPDGSKKSITDLISYTVSDKNELKIEVVYTKAYRIGFDIKYGDLSKHITIKSL